ncbi:MAG TPA: YdeI/OmpD-associated family protein [Phycisphaerae bacterium]|nr:YdeI/OmpD-associated family protein [Phycisphaerae bacterium]
MPETPRFFKDPAAFRAWLVKNHKKAAELLVGLYKKGTGRPSITWPESIAEALCFGWIDGIRRTLDERSYVIRFTPRRKRSKWSAINIKMVAELEAAGRMTDAGRAVFQARTDKDSKGYKAQRKTASLDKPYILEFKKNKSAWSFYSSQPPGYQRMTAWWVMQAKQEPTRQRRLKALIEGSAKGKRLF